jgi:riboflavin synthase
VFTGIIETTGIVSALQKENHNLRITLKAPFTSELKINQSIAHNGACLSVVSIEEGDYSVIAIKETLEKTNLSQLKVGDLINLERCLRIGDRLDGHMVQGHVDCSAFCIEIKETNGSWLFTFEHPVTKDFITVEKGSVCVNGVSLTVVNSQSNSFSVAIIPYTFEHTNFKNLKMGNKVNIEFDILGKYATKLLQQQQAL